MKIHRVGVSAYAAVLLALTALTGCDNVNGAPPASPTASSPSISVSPTLGAGTLVSIEQKASYQVPTRRGEVIADGAVVLRNIGNEAVRLQGVQLVFASGGNGLTVEGAKILRLAGTDVSGIQRSFPPNKQTGQRWHDAVGAEIVPGEGMVYQLILGLSVSVGTHRVEAVRLTYSATGVTREVEIPHDITLCVQGRSTATTCQ